MFRWSSVLSCFAFKSLKPARSFKPSTNLFSQTHFSYKFKGITSQLLRSNFSSTQQTGNNTASAAKKGADDTKISDYLKIINDFNASGTQSKDAVLKILPTFRKLAIAYQKHMDFAHSVKTYSDALSLATKADLLDNIEVGHIYNSLGETYLKQNKLDQALENLNKANQIFSKANSDPAAKVELIRNIYFKAMVLDRKDQFDQALELFKDALKRTNELKGDDLAVTLIVLYDGMAYIFRNRMELDQACEYWKKGLAVATRQYGENSIEAKNFYENLAWVHLDQQKFKEALSYAEKSLQIITGSFGAESYESSPSLYLIGQIHSAQGDNAKALENYQKAVRILEKEPAKDPDQLSYTYMVIATVHWYQNDYNKAREYFNKCVQTMTNAFGEKNANLALHYSSWGHLAKNNLIMIPEAKTALKKALDIYKSLESPNKARMSDIYSSLGEIAFYDDEFDEALKWYKEFLSLSKDVETNPEVLEEVYSAVGTIYLKQEKIEESIEYYEKAVKACHDFEKDHSNLDFHYRNLGTAYEKKGLLAKAEEVFKKDLELATRKHGKEDETAQRSAKLVVEILLKQNKSQEADALRKTYGITA